MTCAPAPSSASAMARPMPLEEPVTRAARADSSSLIAPAPLETGSQHEYLRRSRHMPRMQSGFFGSLLERADVQLHHGHHRLHDALRLFRVQVAKQFGQ